MSSLIISYPLCLCLDSGFGYYTYAYTIILTLTYTFTLLVHLCSPQLSQQSIIWANASQIGAREPCMALGRLKMTRERLAVNAIQPNLAREDKIWPTVAREAIFSICTSPPGQEVSQPWRNWDISDQWPA